MLRALESERRLKFYETIIPAKASLLDRSDSKAVNEYNKLVEDYTELLLGTPKNKRAQKTSKVNLVDELEVFKKVKKSFTGISVGKPVDLKNAPNISGDVSTLIKNML
jgi:hypothetical protein